jgi:hypothetical protein
MREEKKNEKQKKTPPTKRRDEIQHREFSWQDASRAGKQQLSLFQK